MCTLIEQAQQKAADAMDTISVLHPYTKGVPTLGDLAGSFLPEEKEALTDSELKVHREEARRRAHERSQLARDNWTNEERTAVNLKRRTKDQLVRDKRTTDRV